MRCHVTASSYARRSNTNALETIDPIVRTSTIAKSSERRSIHATQTAPHRATSKTILILGGFHGDEPKSVRLCEKFIDFLAADPSLQRRANWIIVPLVNPDGYALRKRRNANKIDLNRNFPTKNWICGDRRSRMFGGDKPASEPETRAVIRCIERHKPAVILTVHSISGNRFCNNFDGPAKRLATRMSRINGYPVEASIGYPTPGSFGNWAGVERRISTITLELPSQSSHKQCWADNRDAILSLALR
jgi:murein peptide amidase A